MSIVEVMNSKPILFANCLRPIRRNCIAEFCCPAKIDQEQSSVTNQNVFRFDVVVATPVLFEDGEDVISLELPVWRQSLS